MKTHLLEALSTGTIVAVVEEMEEDGSLTGKVFMRFIDAGSDESLWLNEQEILEVARILEIFLDKPITPAHTHETGDEPTG